MPRKSRRYMEEGMFFLKFLTHKIHSQWWNSKLIWDTQRSWKNRYRTWWYQSFKRFVFTTINFQHKLVESATWFQTITSRKNNFQEFWRWLGPMKRVLNKISTGHFTSLQKTNCFLFQSLQNLIKFLTAKTAPPTPLASILRTKR